MAIAGRREGAMRSIAAPVKREEDRKKDSRRRRQ
jgi:hypothetical protein